MKQKLLILGDSFGTDLDAIEIRNSIVTYHDILKNSGLFTDVINLAVPSSSFWWAYKQFKRTYVADKTFVLWFVTIPGRISNDRFGHVANHQDAELKLLTESNLNHKASKDQLLKFYRATLDYYMYICDNEFDDHVQYTMLESILKNELHTDFLLVPCFKQSLPENLNADLKSLVEVFYLENTQLVSDPQHWHNFLLKNIDRRPNHLTEPNHKILGKKIIESIQDKKTILKIDVDDFVLPSASEISKYIFKRS